MLVVGDAALIPLPDESVHCVVTSPPYWGLRKYEGVQGIGRFPNLGLEQTPDEYLDHVASRRQFAAASTSNCNCFTKSRLDGS